MLPNRSDCDYQKNGKLTHLLAFVPRVESASREMTASPKFAPNLFFRVKGYCGNLLFDREICGSMPQQFANGGSFKILLSRNIHVMCKQVYEVVTRSGIFLEYRAVHVNNEKLFKNMTMLLVK